MPIIFISSIWSNVSVWYSGWIVGVYCNVACAELTVNLTVPVIKGGHLYYVWNHYQQVAKYELALNIIYMHTRLFYLHNLLHNYVKQIIEKIIKNKMGQNIVNIHGIPVEFSLDLKELYTLIIHPKVCVYQ